MISLWNAPFSSRAIPQTTKPSSSIPATKARANPIPFFLNIAGHSPPRKITRSSNPCSTRTSLQKRGRSAAAPPTPNPKPSHKNCPASQSPRRPPALLRSLDLQQLLLRPLHISSIVRLRAHLRNYWWIDRARLMSPLPPNVCQHRGDLFIFQRLEPGHLQIDRFLPHLDRPMQPL